MKKIKMIIKILKSRDKKAVACVAAFVGTML